MAAARWQLQVLVVVCVAASLLQSLLHWVRDLDIAPGGLRNVKGPQHLRYFVLSSDVSSDGLVLGWIRHPDDVTRVVPAATLPENPGGGFCNQALEFSVAYLRARKLNRVFVLYGATAAAFESLLDMDLLLSYTNGTLLLTREMPYFARNAIADSIVRFAHLKNIKLSNLWCASRVSLDIVRFMQPNSKLRAQAREIVAGLRKSPSDVVVSVHGRSFMPEGCYGRLTRWGPTCHFSSTFAGRDTLCDYSWPVVSALLKQHWPALARSPPALYLSSDGQNASLAQTYHRAGSVDVLRVKQSPTDLPMPVDMLVSALADVYIANPSSTCEPIIAQWRHEQRPAGTSLNQWPQDCYDGFARKPQPSLATLCDHNFQVTLDKPGAMSTCERVLALASAVAKAHAKRGGVLLWGPWLELVREEFNASALAAYINVDARSGELGVDFSVQGSVVPMYFSAALLNPEAEVNCVRGRAVDALRVALRPRNHEAFARALQLAARDTGGKWCHASSPWFATAPFETTSSSSPCGQVLAHWDAALEPRSCYGGFATAPEPTAELIREEFDEFVCGMSQ